MIVACVFVAGPVPYSVDYVVRLERMARRYLRSWFRFVCLTDQAAAFKGTGIETVSIASRADVPANGRGYWAKIELFRPGVFSGAADPRERVLYLDLDSLIVGDLAPLAEYPGHLALITDVIAGDTKARATVDRYGRQIVRRFNSSAMVWTANDRILSPLYYDWTPDVAARLSTDQDWIGEQCAVADGMPYEWFPRISRQQPPWPSEAKVVLVKKPKCHQAVDRWPWFEQAWGGWKRGTTVAGR